MKAAAQRLPSSPQIFGKLGKLLKDPGSDMREIADLVNTDASLTARVIRISNSASYCLGNPVDSLDEAINRIGFKELFRVVGMAAVSIVFAGRNDTYGVDGQLIWENALASGIAMEQLAQLAGEESNEAYTLGLLRSMGKLVIDACARNHSEPPIYEPSSGTPLPVWEKKTFGISNAGIAGHVLQAWNFPENAYQAIQFQYQPDRCPSAYRICRLLNIAGGIAERLGKVIPGESSYWEMSETVFGEVDMVSEDVDEICDIVSGKLFETLGSVAA